MGGCMGRSMGGMGCRMGSHTGSMQKHMNNGRDSLKRRDKGN